MAPFSPLELLSSLASSAALAKRDDGASLQTRATQSTSYTPGSGTVDPTTINNNAIFALFGILGAGCVLTGIWFFFWAKNGGCVFRRGDWDEYKSTVLRRKGPNGTTLSGATKTTDLGGGSIVGSQGSMSEFGDPEKAEAGGRKVKKTRRNGKDDDVRAYRTEKVARVGGLNREADGAYHDYSTTEGTSLNGSQPAFRHGVVNANSSHRDTVRPVRTSDIPTRQYSFNAGTEVSFSVASEASSHRLLNPAPQYNNRHSQPSAANNKRASGAPRHGQYGRVPERSSMPGGYTEPLDFDSRHGGSDLGERNTKAYFHPIPGLSSHNGAPTRGFRRGGGGRRDSLSDSEDASRSYRS